MEKKMNNKGFSLVELIIVIAIMAVLVGILAPQYLKYVKNSRISTDITNAEEIATAVNVAISDPEEKVVKITSGTAFAGDADLIADKVGGTETVTVKAPKPKTTTTDTWIVTYDSTKGVTAITLGGKAIYPNSTEYETEKRK